MSGLHAFAQFKNVQSKLIRKYLKAMVIHGSANTPVPPYRS
jgi:hypothetical protein